MSVWYFLDVQHCIGIGHWMLGVGRRYRSSLGVDGLERDDIVAVVVEKHHGIWIVGGAVVSGFVSWTSAYDVGPW